MRRLATLFFAVLVPIAAAQTFPTPSAETQRALRLSPTRVAPGDTTYLSNIPEGTTQISTWEFGQGTGNYLFGTNAADIFGFGSAYDLTDVGAGAEAELEVIGGSLYITAVPETDTESFEVSVYDGTLEDGPVGDPVHVQTYSSGIIPDVSENGVPPTDFYFDVPVVVDGPVFFITFDVVGITSELAAGATGDQDVAVPETIFRVPTQGGDPAWFRVDQVVSAGEGNPLETYLFSEAFVLEGGEEFVVRPIADARDVDLGETVTIEGTISRAEGNFVYLQDETAGLTIRQTAGDFFDQVADNTIRHGVTVRVTGTIDEFSGLLYLSTVDEYDIIAYGPIPEPQTVTLAELAANGEAYEGELVLVTDVTFDDPPAQFEAATTYQVTDPSDATNAVAVRVPAAADTEIDGTDFLGNPARVTGVVGQSSTDPAEGYQILLLEVGEVMPNAVATAEDPEGRLGLSPLVPNPSASGADVTVTLAEAGRAALVVYDVLGREVARVLDRDLAAGDTAVRVDVTDLPAGTYLARLSAAGTTVARPFTVAR